MRAAVSTLPRDQVEGEAKTARVVAVATPAPPRRRRRRPWVTLLAVVAYGSAATVATLLVLSVLDRDTVSESGISAAEPAAALPSEDSLLAMRTLAARAQRGVYALEAGGARRSAFVGWVQPGLERSYLLTARANVAGLLADGARVVYVRRGSQFWTGRLWAVDGAAGLALVRVDAVLERPLWQDDDQPGELRPGGRTFVIPAGAGTAFAEGTAEVGANGTFRVPAGADPLFVGAPVVNSSGRVGGVVVSTTPGGIATVTPIDRACENLRRCGFP